MEIRGRARDSVSLSRLTSSSGSPVFLSDTGTYRSRDGAVVVGSRIMVLGVLATVHTAQVGGTVAALPAQQTVQIHTPIGLGIVYKAETIEPVPTFSSPSTAPNERRPSRKDSFDHRPSTVVQCQSDACCRASG